MFWFIHLLNSSWEFKVIRNDFIYGSCSILPFCITLNLIYWAFWATLFELILLNLFLLNTILASIVNYSSLSNYLSWIKNVWYNENSTCRTCFFLFRLEKEQSNGANTIDEWIHLETILGFFVWEAQWHLIVYDNASLVVSHCCGWCWDGKSNIVRNIELYILWHCIRDFPFHLMICAYFNTIHC